MAVVYIAGDVHRSIDIDKLDRLANKGSFTKQDVIIIAGDMGILWSQYRNREEVELIERYEFYPFTTAFVDGNHENHVRLSTLNKEEKWGSDVGVISNSIFHLKRGRVYNINGKTIWTMGGAFSIDKASRVEFVSWWPQEQPSCKEMQEGLYRLDLHKREVDAVITHTAPRQVFNKMNTPTSSKYNKFKKFAYKDAKEELALQEYLQQVSDTTKFSNWFFGHFHDDIDIDEKFHCLYERVLDIDGDVILNQS